MPPILGSPHPQLALFGGMAWTLIPPGSEPLVTMPLAGHMYGSARGTSGLYIFSAFPLYSNSPITNGDSFPCCWSTGMSSPRDHAAAIALRIVEFFVPAQQSRHLDPWSLMLQGQEAQIPMLTGSDSELSYSSLVPNPCFLPFGDTASHKGQWLKE